MDKLQKNSEYILWFKEIKEKISRAQIRAALAANRELILFYWELGEMISGKLEEAAWGNKVIDQLSKDLATEFPGIQGFSPPIFIISGSSMSIFQSFCAQR